MADQPDLSLTRSPTLAQSIDVAVRRGIAEIHVALPAKVSKVDLTKQLVDVDLQVQSLAQLDEDGTRTPAPIPTLTNVPIEFPGANGFRITFPVAVGDLGMVVFQEADIATWKRNGGTKPASDRRHHLADGVFRPGLKPYSGPWTDVPSDGITVGKDGSTQVVVKDGLVDLGGQPSAASTEAVQHGTSAQAALDTLVSSSNQNATTLQATVAPLIATPPTTLPTALTAIGTLVSALNAFAASTIAALQAYANDPNHPWLSTVAKVK